MKTFSTITLRNLDSEDSKDVIEILNDFMNESDIKTGQAAIEGIVRKYYKVQKLAKDLQTAKNKLEKELEETKKDWQAETKALKNTLNTFSIFTADLAALNEGINALQELQKTRSQITSPKHAFNQDYSYDWRKPKPTYQEDPDENEE